MNRQAVARELVKVAKLLVSSVSRHCDLYKARNGKWYMNLGEEEHDEYRDSRTYGPFDSQEETDEFLSAYFSNPGSSEVDDSGKQPVPTRSPNGDPVVNPERHSRW